MEGFLWLLTQMLVPLTAAAAVFLTLGWRWGRRSVDQTVDGLSRRVDAEDQDAAALRREIESLRAAKAALHETRARLDLELKESQERETRLQKEVLRLADERPAAAKPAARGSAVVDAKTKLASLKQLLQTLEERMAALRAEEDVWRQQEAASQGKGGDRRALARARRKLERVETESARLAREHAALAGQAAFLENALSTTVEQPDDLTRVSGIKEVTARHLREHGIRSLRQIAAWTEADLDAAGALLAVKHRPRREHWVEQARRLLEQDETGKPAD